MRRRFIRFLSLLSLLLAVGTAVFWVRGYRALEQAKVWRWSVGPTASTTHMLKLETHRFGVMVTFDRQRYTYGAGEAARVMGPPGVEWAWDVDSTGPVLPPYNAPPGAWSRFGFEFATDRRFGTPSPTQTVAGRVLQVRVPHWFLLALFLLLPGFRALSVFRGRCGRRRAASGLCPSCGYDLRATPGMCPECGAGCGA